MSAKRILKSIVPPFLWRIGQDINRRLRRSVDYIAYAPEGWATHLPADPDHEAGWTTFIERERSVCETLMARVRAGEPLSLSDTDERVKHLTFGYVLALAAHDTRTLSVLDYGGNLGDYYWLGRALVPGVDLDYHCKELPRLAVVGRQINPAVTWHTDDECLDQPRDLVMFVSSLQCLPEWRDTLRRAARSTRQYLFLSDVATVSVPSYVVTVRQGGATCLHAALDRSEIVATVAGTGLRLVREFDMGAHPPVANAPEQPTCVGWLFERARP